MRSRREILLDIILLNGELPKLLEEISTFEWDVDEPIVTLTRDNLYKVLHKLKNNEFETNLIEDWANALESRDDLTFENETVKEVIIELANPILNEPLDPRRLTELMERIA